MLVCEACEMYIEGKRARLTAETLAGYESAIRAHARAGAAGRRSAALHARRYRIRPPSAPT